VVLTAKRIETSVEVPKIDLIEAAIPPRPRILVVEDSFMLVLTVEAMCEELGWEVVGPATRLKSALLLAEAENIDAALLDVNLDGEMSWEVAAILKKRGIPFAFSTGYDEGNLLPENLVGSRIVTKPYEMGEVEQTLRQLMTANVANQQHAL
jgi:CheY-like chemotaxis protein